jgi:hypothetical protein
VPPSGIQPPARALQRDGNDADIARVQTSMTRRLSGLACLPALAVSLLVPAAGAAVPALTVRGAPLAGATIASGSTVTATGAGAVKVTWVLDGQYLGADVTAPFTVTVQSRAGLHLLRARAYDAAGNEFRQEASFTVLAGTGTPTAPTGTTLVSDGPGLVRAVSSARPGTVIDLADGYYSAQQAFTVSTACTAAAPCTLRGGRGAVLDGHGTSGVYGLHLRGASHWTVSGFTVTDAAKGVVLDLSHHNVLAGLEVHGIGDEGIHLRAASSDNVVRGNLVHDTGTRSPGFGEGLYVGSARSNWGTYSGGGPDRSDRNVLTGNTVRNTAAESVGIKEGTTGGTLSNNSFDGTGMSGVNYADSWVDLKGNAWSVSGNRGVRAPLDGFQTDVALNGWGQRNVFRSNVADTTSSGYGFRVEQPATSSNTVACDNTAASARAGLSNLPCG